MKRTVQPSRERRNSAILPDIKMNTLAVFCNVPYLEYIYGSSKCEAVKGHEKHGSGTCYNLRSPRNFAFTATAVARDIGITMQELHNA